MKTIVLELEVHDEDLDSLNASLNKTEANFKDVDQAAAKTSKSVDDVAKNGGAIATLDRLTGGAASQMRDLFESTKLFNFSLKGTRTALIATGIGAFVVILGVVVAYWDEIVEFITEANKRLQRQIDLNKRNLAVLDGELKLLESKEKLLIAEGKSTTAIRKEKEAVLLIQQEQNQLLIENLSIQLERERALVKEVTAWEKIKIAFLAVTQQSGAAATAVAESVLGSEEQKARLDELAEGLLAAQVRANDLKIALINLNNPTTDGEEEVDTGVSQPLTDAQIAALDQTRTLEDAKTQILQEGEAHRKAIEEQGFDDSQLILDAKLAAQMEFAGALGNVLGNIAGLFGEATAASKVAALAEIAIGTGVGFIQGLDIAQKGAKAAGPAAPFAFPVFYATQVAAVLAAASRAKSILATAKGGGGSGGSFSAPSIGGAAGGSIPTPEFSVVGDTGINQLGQVIGEELGVERRAYVVMGDLEKGQRIQDNSIREATV